MEERPYYTYCSLPADLSKRQAGRSIVALPTAVTIYLNLDSIGRILAANAAVSTLGYGVEDVVGRSLLSLFGANEQRLVQSALKQVQERQTEYTWEGQIRCANGAVLPTSNTLQSWFGVDQSPTLLLICHLRSTDPLSRAALRQDWQHYGFTLITSFVQQIRQSFDQKQILRATAEQIMQIFQTDRALIYRIYGNTGSLVVESTAAGCETITHKPFPEIVIPEALLSLEEGQVWAIASLDQVIMPAHLKQALRQSGVQSMLVLPLRQGEHLWGLLILHQCHTPRVWTTWETELLGQLAGQVEITLEQSELYQQVQRLNINLERTIQKRTAELQIAYNFEATLKRITDKVRDSLDEDQILQVAVQELATVIGVGACNAALYDLEQSTSTIRYEYTTTVSPSHGRTSQISAFPEIYGPLLQGQCVQFCSVTPNPVRGHVSMLAAPIFDDQGVLGDLWLIHHKYYAFTDQDIRLVQQVANQCAIAIRQARLFQAVQGQVDELARLNRLKDDFLSTVSHELRTPMSSIKVAIQMLEITLKQSGILEQPDHRAARYFRILNDECQREINLINDLLDLSQIETGSEQLTLSPVYFQDWLQSIVQSFEERAQNHQQSLTLQVTPDLTTTTVDVAKLERILRELLTNACKYTPSGGQMVVHAQLMEPLGDALPSLQLSVNNTGTEIPAEECDRIFEKFYRIPNNDPWQYGGTGLGLALVKKLVEHLGGKIAVRSQSGETCFKLEIPLHG